MSTVRRGRHFLERDGRPILPVGAHHVPVEGPDWPWRVGPEAFDTTFAAMAAAGLDTVRIDLLWAAVEPEPGVYDEIPPGDRSTGSSRPPSATGCSSIRRSSSAARSVMPTGTCHGGPAGIPTAIPS